MAYGKSPPTSYMLALIRDDIEAVAARIADDINGGGKIAAVSILVTFGDGTSIAYEATRTPTP